VSLLSFVLCVWLLAVSSHVHSADEPGGDRGPSAHCTFCLSLPSAAPAPALPLVEVARALANHLDYSCIENRQPEQLAGYFSRGPPVA
jgi:hypothetical protein